MDRPERRGASVVALAVILCMTAGGAGAETATPTVPDAGGLGDRIARAAEMPAHRWLAEVRNAPEATLAPFTTDGCSGGMSALWTEMAERFPAFAEAHEGRPPWEECCVIYDRAYHLGGADPEPAASFAARQAADDALRACVAATADSRDEVLHDRYGLGPGQVRLAYATIAAAMYRAVRLGGGPCSGLPWRWGYGWPTCGPGGG